MHEMSIALSIIDAVVAKAEQEQSRKVSEIELEVGRVSGIQPESLKFCFSAAAKNTIVDGADLAIREIEPVGKCQECGKSFPVSDVYAKCEVCGSLNVRIISGRELLIKSITLE
ncbi:hydrogenase maturation nickel metallochaperone HypA [Prosthecochloris sp.]|uniref:hydrogenase maturation nickel metallochaperone HypA n=1 Tax=Prosthecochloris sp. TaxID=290513 RepID=UPI00257D14ED|nr:hydrogenase maturation nickel metallochaperone HypA [Prosthecochloris sp.]